MPMPSNPLPFRADDEEEKDKDISNAGAAMMNKFLDARTVLIFGGVDQKLYSARQRYGLSRNTADSSNKYNL